MSSCAVITEKSYGIQLTSIATVTSGGTILSIPATKWSDNFTTLTIYNDTTQGVRFTYLSKDGGTGEFIIPKDKVYTRKLYNTSFIKDSIIIYSVDSSSTATGLLTTNIGV